MTRIDIINSLVRTFGYTSYLEIGIAHGHCFNEIAVTDKLGVDPDKNSVGIHIDSDTFFSINSRRWDIVFIDGLHHWEQCLRDIENAMAVSDCVVCHDMLPTSEAMQAVPRTEKIWTGDVWRAWLKVTAGKVVVNTDFGVGVIHPELPIKVSSENEYTFAEWMTDRVKLMNAVNPDEWLSILSSMRYARQQKVPG